MAKFNTKDKRAPRGGPIASSPTPTGVTANGAPGYGRNAKSELFLLACSNMVSEDTFYEKGKVRDIRYTQLVHSVATTDPKWLGRFLPWLRNTANMRTASVVLAVEAAVAMSIFNIPGGRRLVNDALVRADEPGEALAYCMSVYERIPKPVKRGVADAAARLYTERNAIKYDTESKRLRFGDVLELVHAKPEHLGQDRLFRFLITRGKGRSNLVTPDELTMFVANDALRRQARSTPEVLLNTARLRQAGITWEAALSLNGGRVSDRALWEALIPEMGYMALIRNLRNFDEAGVKGDMAAWVVDKLTDPAEVARSRQLPLRFLAAYREVPSNRWAQALEVALDLCLASLPSYPGKTLILIDTSSSMNDPLSSKSTLLRWDAAAVFGLALALRCEKANVVSYAIKTVDFNMKPGESLLKALDRFRTGGYFISGGTDTFAALRRYAPGHDRVVLITDEQANRDGEYGPYVPKGTKLITFNLGGYQFGHLESGRDGNSITIGGLSDAAFTLLPALEGHGAGQWPF